MKEMTWKEIVEDMRIRGYDPSEDALACVNLPTLDLTACERFLELPSLIRSRFKDALYKARMGLQKRFRGLSDAEVGFLDISLAKWLLPRLKVHRLYYAPMKNVWARRSIQDMPNEEWLAILDEIIWSLEFYLYEWSTSCDDWNWVRCLNGFQLLGTYLPYIWSSFRR